MTKYTIKLKNSDIKDNLTIRRMLSEFKKHGCSVEWVVPFNSDRKGQFIMRDSPNQKYIIIVDTKDFKIQGLIAYSPKHGFPKGVNVISIDNLCSRTGTKGNGRILMEEMIADNKKNTEYTVVSIPSSAGFYKKFGFHVWKSDEHNTFMYRREK